MRIIAVDFDGTLCKDAYPGIGVPNLRLIRSLIANRKNGDKLILWTCREGEHLQEAVDWCKARGLEFDAVNENVPELKEKYGTDPRKIGCNLMIDDKAVKPYW
jgi:hypothetical protein